MEAHCDAPSPLMDAHTNRSIGTCVLAKGHSGPHARDGAIWPDPPIAPDETPRATLREDERAALLAALRNVPICECRHGIWHHDLAGCKAACGCSRTPDDLRAAHVAEQIAPLLAAARAEAVEQAATDPKHVARVVRYASVRAHNGAHDPWQEVYDACASPVLERVAGILEDHEARRAAHVEPATTSSGDGATYPVGDAAQAGDQRWEKGVEG